MNHPSFGEFGQIHFDNYLAREKISVWKLQWDLHYETLKTGRQRIYSCKWFKVNYSDDLIFRNCWWNYERLSYIFVKETLDFFNFLPYSVNWRWSLHRYLHIKIASNLNNKFLFISFNCLLWQDSPLLVPIKNFLHCSCLICLSVICFSLNV